MGMDFVGRFGSPRKECGVKGCTKEITEFRVLKLTIKHKDSQAVLAEFEYDVPLCEDHRQGSPLDIELGWLDKLEPLKDVLA